MTTKTTKDERIKHLIANLNRHHKAYVFLEKNHYKPCGTFDGVYITTAPVKAYNEATDILSQKKFKSYSEAADFINPKWEEVTR